MKELHTNVTIKLADRGDSIIMHTIDYILEAGRQVRPL